MVPITDNTFARLQSEINLMQGFKPASPGLGISVFSGSIRSAFPSNDLPLGAVHEFVCNKPEQSAASAGYLAAILGQLLKQGGASLWIRSGSIIFPAALKTFGIDPSNIIFLDTRSEKEKLWAMEEALKCDGLVAVVGEIKGISFTQSRRLQLAVEHSKVTGFLLRQDPKNLASASVTRWHIQHAPSETNELPGVGFPRWNVDLLKVRNGKPGNWVMEYKSGKLREVLMPADKQDKWIRKVV